MRWSRAPPLRQTIAVPHRSPNMAGPNDDLAILLGVTRALLTHARSAGAASPETLRQFEDTINAAEKRLAGQVDTAIADFDWLNAQGFTHVGYWVQPDLKLKRLAEVSRQLGVYAFVIAGKVRYLGEANPIQSRPSGYNRATDPPHPRPPRPLHTAIHQAWKAGDCVDVWFRRVFEGDEAPGVLAARWIAELQPPWNVAGP